MIKIESIKKKVAFSLVFIGIALVLITNIHAQSNEKIKGSEAYDYGRETICEENSCKVFLSSWVRFVPEDGRWKPIENARRLDDKGIFNINYLEDDKIHGLNIIKFNYSCITIGFSSQDITKFEYNKDIPVKIDGNIEGYAKIPSIFSPSVEVEYCFEDSILDHNYSFGEKSTTITLDDDPEECLGDNVITQSVASNMYNDSRTIIKWNISNLYVGYDIVIDDAQLYLYVTEVDSGWDDDVTIYRIDNQSWEEHDDADNLYSMDKDNEYNLTGAFGDTGYQNITVTDVIYADYIDNNYNSSIWIQDQDDTGLASNWSYTTLHNAMWAGKYEYYVGTSYTASFISRHYSNTSRRPYLVITYSMPNPCFEDFESFESGWGNWSDIDQGECTGWIRDSDGTGTSSTGPCEDGNECSIDGSYYIYVETSSSGNGCYYAGDTAVAMLEREINFTNSGSITFYSHMYGSEIGYIYLEENTTGSWETVWSESGNKGNEWIYNIVPLSSLNGTGQLRFRYEAVGGWFGDIALDYIKVDMPCNIPEISETLNPDTVYEYNATNVTIYGVAQWSNGTPIEDTQVHIYFNETEIGISSCGAGHTDNGDGTCNATYKIANGKDDTFGQTWTGQAETNYVDYGYLRFGVGQFGTYYYNDAYLRWSVDIPDGATIDYAAIDFFANSAASASFTSNISLLTSDNQINFSLDNYANASELRTIGNYGNVQWTPSAWTANNHYLSPDVSELVQAFIDNESYASGNYIGLKLGWGSEGAANYRVPDSYESAGAVPANLTITYTPYFVKTNSSGDYSYTYEVNRAVGEYPIKVNITFDGETANNTKNLSVTSVPDFAFPEYSINYTNSSKSGSYVMHSLMWEDNLQLSGYIFSFDNGSGLFVNDSLVSFSGPINWSNVTKYVNETTGTTIRWCVYANDTSGNMNSSSCDNPFSYATQNSTITLAYPSEYEVVQRFNSTTGEIMVSGSYSGDPLPIEGRFNYGNWISINDTPSGGVFTGSINATVGNGSFSVKFAGSPDIEDSVSNMGVGDVYAIGGQSNAAGYGDTLNNVTNKTYLSGMFYEGGWVQCADPTNNGTGSGSPWPIVVSGLVSNESIPIGIINKAVDGSAINTWHKGQANYNNMIGEINSMTHGTMKVKSMMFFQGETDSGTSGCGGDYDCYMNNLTEMADDFIDDTEIAETVMVGQISGGVAVGSTRERVDNIRKAQQDAWDMDNNISEGAITYDINMTGFLYVHFGPDVEIGAFANRWSGAIEEVIYNNGDGTSPTLDTITMSANDTHTNLTLTFNDASLPLLIMEFGGTSGSKVEGWLINDSGEVYNDTNISSATVDNDTIRLIVDGVLSYNFRLSYGSFYDARGKYVAVDSSSPSHNPLRPIYNEQINLIPFYSENSTNSTEAGSYILHSLRWDAINGLSGYIFSFDNGTGSMENDSWIPLTGALNWSNVTKYVNETEGSLIRWCVYANDTVGNTNGTSCDNPFSYATTTEGDTCSCSSLQAGNPIDCSENCMTDQECDLGGVTVSTVNAGHVWIIYNITKFGGIDSISDGCNITFLQDVSVI